MKLNNNIFILFIMSAVFASCDLAEIDNFSGPNSELSGRIIDEESGELIQQDIINGCRIEIWEHGYDPVTPQRLEIKTDGSYKDSRLFANSYTVIPISTNFHNVDTVEMEINGVTILDFTVTPYIRIKDATIEKVGDIITANFRVEQTIDSVMVNDSTNAPIFVKKVGLYGHRDPNVGEPMQLGKEEASVNQVMVPGVNDTFMLEFDLSRDIDFIGDRVNKTYFRIGAILDMPDARYNYAPTVEIEL